MPVNGTNTQPKSAPSQPRSAAASRSDNAFREGLSKVRSDGASYARQTAGRTVDVPVGAALTVADRVT